MELTTTKPTTIESIRTHRLRDFVLDPDHRPPAFAEPMYCEAPGCPGRGERLTWCGNPDHWAIFVVTDLSGELPPPRSSKRAKIEHYADPLLNDNENERRNAQLMLDTLEFTPDEDTALRASHGFHRQRTASLDGGNGWHGETRRGRPSDYCSLACQRWESDHFDHQAVDMVGTFIRIRKRPQRWARYVLNHADAEGDVVNVGPDYQTYRQALNGVKVLLAQGVFVGMAEAERGRVINHMLTPVFAHDRDIDIDGASFGGRTNGSHTSGVTWPLAVEEPAEQTEAEEAWIAALSAFLSTRPIAQRVIAGLRFTPNSSQQHSYVSGRTASRGWVIADALIGRYPEIMAEWLRIFRPSVDATRWYARERWRQAHVRATRDVVPQHLLITESWFVPLTPDELAALTGVNKPALS